MQYYYFNFSLLLTFCIIMTGRHLLQIPTTFSYILLPKQQRYQRYYTSSFSRSINKYNNVRRIVYSTTSNTTTLESLLDANDNNNNNNKDITDDTKIKKQQLTPKEKRQKLIGLAKAVDRGQYAVTYSPGTIVSNSIIKEGQGQQQQQSSLSSTNTFLQYTSKSNLPNRTKLFTVLGIESSCDDTGAAIVRSDGIILGEALACQGSIHEQWGGIVPILARDEHIKQINTVIHQALINANLSSIEHDIDAIGVTVGPGLELCLRVGTNKAIDLAIQYNKPFIGIHHLEAHILMARMPYYNNNSTTGTTAATTTTTTTTSTSTNTNTLLPVDNNNNQQNSINDNNDTTNGLYYIPGTDTIHESYRSIEFPFLALLVSGGHCQIIKCYNIGHYIVMGGTIDDSLGEAYDKTARLLGLPIGGGAGGPAIEQLALNGNPASIPLSIPMSTRTKDCDFSFAGLKTNVRRCAEKLCAEQSIVSPDLLPFIDKANIAASFQNIAIKHLEQRIQIAMNMIEKEEEQSKIKNYSSSSSNSSSSNSTSSETVQVQQEQYTKKIRTLAVVGGVAANTEIRTRLQTLCTNRHEPWIMKVPPPRLCTDQGAMSAWAAIERIMVGSSDDPHTQEVYARYPFAVLEDDPTTINQQK